MSCTHSTTPRHRPELDSGRHRGPTTPGRTSPGSCTGTTSAGRYYVSHGHASRTAGTSRSCPPARRTPARPASGTRCRGSTPCARTGRLGNVQPLKSSTTPAHGTLPGRQLGDPRTADSEHPPASIDAGQAYVTAHGQRGHARARSGTSTAIFLTWDDWGGFYDHVVPPGSTATATGCACPGSSSAPTRKQGYIDHQTLSFDAYLKFIEDDFLAGPRLDPATDGRPDPAPEVRENVSPASATCAATSTSAPRRAPRCCSPLINASTPASHRVWADQRIDQGSLRPTSKRDREPSTVRTSSALLATSSQEPSLGRSRLRRAPPNPGARKLCRRGLTAAPP